MATELKLYFLDSLEAVEHIALDFANNVIPHADINSLSVVARSSVDTLSMEKSARVFVCSKGIQRK